MKTIFCFCLFFLTEFISGQVFDPNSWLAITTESNEEKNQNYKQQTQSPNQINSQLNSGTEIQDNNQNVFININTKSSVVNPTKTDFVSTIKYQSENTTTSNEKDSTFGTTKSQLIPVNHNYSNEHYSYKDMATFMESVSSQYPELANVYSIGKSSTGKELLVLELGKSTGKSSKLKPHVKLYSDGDELGKEFLLKLIHHLVSNFNKETSVRWLLENTRIHILPSLYPDLEMPCHLDSKGHSIFTSKHSESEMRSFMKWGSNFKFVLSANFHNKNTRVTYPFHEKHNSLLTYTSENKTPDDDVFQHLALSYTNSLHRGIEQVKCKEDLGLNPIKNDLADSDYILNGCLEMSIGLGCCKNIKNSPRIWSENLESILSFIKQAHVGVKGIVTDEFGRPVAQAKLKVRGREIKFYTSAQGSFWRILLPGIYTMDIFAEGFVNKNVQFAIINDKPTSLNIRLQPNKDTLKNRMENIATDRFDGPVIRRLITFTLTRKDIKNLIEWSFGLLNVINLLNIIGYLM